MSAKTDALASIYVQLEAPAWAATNLDGLADVLRDLSWRPEGTAQITLPDLDGLTSEDREALLHVLARAVSESITSPRPLHVRAAGD